MEQSANVHVQGAWGADPSDTGGDSDTDDSLDATDALAIGSKRATPEQPRPFSYRGIRGGRRVRRYRFTHAPLVLNDELEEIQCDEVYTEGPIEGEYLTLCYQDGDKQATITVHKELYGFAAGLNYLAKRTTLQARGLMSKCMNYCSEKNVASVYDAYKLSSAVVAAVQAVTPAERQYADVVGSPATGRYIDEANDLAGGKITLTITRWESFWRFVTLAISVALVWSGHMIAYCVLNYVAAGSAVVWYGGVMLLCSATYGIYDQYCRCSTKFYRLVPEK